jgi:NTE family protein
LSGGGVRATVFHLGVLGRLAAEGLLEQVTFLSTVSGGSLAIGLVRALAGGRWPASEEYLQRILPEARQRLTEIDLQRDIVRRTARKVLTRPWVLLQGRANLVAESLAERWGVRGLVKDLPVSPRWVINATAFESGKGWRFMAHRMGDYVLHYAREPAVPIADAVAASAAFPGAISYLVMRTADFDWYRYNDDTGTATEPIDPKTTYVHLWDAGVYDNLGVEALFKPGRESYRDEFNFLIVSDASGEPGLARPGFLIVNAKRLLDIARDQVRGLRARMIVDRFVRQPGTGVYLRIGRTAEYICDRAKPDAGRRATLTAGCLGEAEVLFAKSYATTLRRLRPEDFDILCRHGWEVTNCTLTGYYPGRFENLGWQIYRPRW